MSKRAVPRPDNLLSHTDQLLFFGQRATGQELVIQYIWVYEHPVDLDALKRFHLNLGYGLAGRRIEVSPLPFGRHRWVSSLGAPAELEIAECARPRSDFSDWADERAQLPIDPEWGPGWHLGVLPMTDGSTAVSLLISHCLADGFGVFATVLDAVKGNRRDLGHPPPRSRGRARAVAADLRQTATDVPEVARALVAAAKMAYRDRQEIRSKASRPRAIAPEGDDSRIFAPAVAVYVDLHDWDARAKALGGNSHSLIAGFIARLGERTGRRRAQDGAVTLHIPISDRTEGDTRANAVSIAMVSVDPTQVTTDLSRVRATVGQALQTMREVPDETMQLLPLIPFVPKRVVNGAGDVVFGFADLPVSCSNLGDVDPVITRADGTDAEYFVMRGVDRYVTRNLLDRRGGLLTVVAGRVGGKMSLSIVGYQPGAENTKVRLRELAAQTLAEFGLTGAME